MKKMFIYQNIEPIDINHAEKIFLIGKDEEICRVLVALSFYEKDWKRVQDICLAFLLNKNSIIRGLAATCLGHIARIHKKLEKEKVVKALLENLETEIAGQVQDALDDIEIFLP